MKESVSGPHYRPVRKERMEKHIGCMSGFLQIFDRQQLLAGKRIHSTKRLSPSTDACASAETESSCKSPKHAFVVLESPDNNSRLSKAERANAQLKSPVLVSASSLKPCKEIHRHSLDSKLTNSNTTVADTDENQRRSPSVIARLMGLEPLSFSNLKRSQTATKPALQRSASESNISRDQIHQKYIDNNNFQLKQPNKQVQQTVTNRDTTKSREASRTSHWRSRTYYNSTDLFPEQDLKTVRMQAEFDKRLKMKVLDELQSSNDISTLKQILEVLQLKGLLHSTNARNLHLDEPNIVLVKPIRSSATKVDNVRNVTDSRRSRRLVSENSMDISPKRDGGVVYRSERNPMRVGTYSPNRIESNLKACNPNTNTKQLSIEVQLKVDKYSNSVKVSESNSIKVACKRPKRIGSVKGSKLEGCAEGKSLLHSKMETNSNTESPTSSAAVIPSPVSVLDSGFDTDELLTPLHCVDLKAVDYKDTNESPKLSPTNPTKHEDFTSDDSDFIYISEIVQASQNHHEDPYIFLSIEKQLHNTNNTLNVSKPHIKLVFDVVLEIIDETKQLPPWKTPIEDPRALLKHIWSKFQKIREVSTSDGVLEVISGVIKKDLVDINSWKDYPFETSEAIRDIERMIFKDLVSEAIRDLVEFSGECMLLRARRRLVF